MSTTWYIYSSWYSLLNMLFVISFLQSMGSRLSVLNGSSVGSHHSKVRLSPVSVQSHMGIITVWNSRPFDLCTVMMRMLSMLSAGMLLSCIVSSQAFRNLCMSALRLLMYCAAWSRNAYTYASSSFASVMFSNASICSISSYNGSSLRRFNESRNSAGSRVLSCSPLISPLKLYSTLFITLL